jgi:hypothetical protein
VRQLDDSLVIVQAHQREKKTMKCFSLPISKIFPGICLLVLYTTTLLMRRKDCKSSVSPTPAITAAFSIPWIAEEPGSVHLYLGTVAWRWAGGCGGDRRDYDDCHVAAGDDLLDLCAAATACRFVGGVGGPCISVRRRWLAASSNRSKRSSRSSSWQ